ncbi:PREDICTED: protein FAM53A-like [Priapulus caudatus]|uniref:Protein FAM53A-like n=1 Tax=Priapulus caudatus TaxID=37621 RepID=A0ABM1DUT2_PRICU|nr:PREDICTED: protein FAM53A-like [Priapulus caudatus]
MRDAGRETNCSPDCAALHHSLNTQLTITGNSAAPCCESHESDMLRTPNTPPKKRHCRSLSTPCCYHGDNREDHHSQSYSQGNICYSTGHAHQPPGELRPQHIRRDLCRERHLSGDTAFFCRERHYSADAFGQGKKHQYLCGLHRPAALYGSLGSSELKALMATQGKVGASPSGSPIPRPASAASKPYDFSAKLSRPLDCATDEDHFKIRSLSLSEDHISLNCARRAACKCAGAQRLSRTRSQPCVSEKKYGIKRRRPKEKHRPSIDFYKMKETAFTWAPILANSCSTATERNNFQCLRPTIAHPELNTIASSPLEPSHMAAHFGDMPEQEIPGKEHDVIEGAYSSTESDLEADGRSMGVQNVGHFSDLDLDQIENN